MGGLRVFSVKYCSGYIGGHAIVVAESPERAIAQLEASKDAMPMLDRDPKWEIAEVDVTAPRIFETANGDY